MPTYTYRCQTCGQTFEAFQSITAAPLEYCLASACTSPSSKGKGKVERVITGGAGLIFNGSGFYITDYKRSSSSQSSSACADGSCACSSNSD